jgi:hypothetical protein
MLELADDDALGAFRHSPAALTTSKTSGVTMKNLQQENREADVRETKERDDGANPRTEEAVTAVEVPVTPGKALESEVMGLHRLDDRYFFGTMHTRPFRIGKGVMLHYYLTKSSITLT